MGDVMENVMKGRCGNGGEELGGAVQRKINDALRNTFRPEFLNRIDEVITFHALSIANMEPIVELQLNDVRTAPGRSPHYARRDACCHGASVHRRLRSGVWRASLQALGAA